MNLRDQIEALTVLDSSEGWSVLKQQVAQVHSPQRVLDKLAELLKSSPSADAFGLKAAIIVAESKAIEGVQLLPRALVEVFEREEAKHG